MFETSTGSATSLLRDSRRNAGFSQRALAALAETSQCAVARIESGKVSPTWTTLERLVAATGHRLAVQLERVPVVAPEWLDEVDRIRALTPGARMQELANLSAFYSAARRRD